MKRDNAPHVTGHRWLSGLGYIRDGLWIYTDDKEVTCRRVGSQILSVSMGRFEAGPCFLAT